MKKTNFSAIIISVFLLFASSAGANLLTNGDFDDGFNGWITRGDVRLGDTADPLGFLAEAQGMEGNYALLGLNTTDERSTLRQDFDVTGYTQLTISFNWAFNYLDFSGRNDDTFLSFVRDDDDRDIRISLMDLESNGSRRDPELGIEYGFYSDIIDISAFTSDEGRLIFRLIEEGWGTQSLAAIDNVSVAGAPVPEPATLLLFGTGLLGLSSIFRKKIIKK